MMTVKVWYSDSLYEYKGMVSALETFEYGLVLLTYSDGAFETLDDVSHLDVNKTDFGDANWIAL